MGSDSVVQLQLSYRLMEGIDARIAELQQSTTEITAEAVADAKGLGAVLQLFTLFGCSDPRNNGFQEAPAPPLCASQPGPATHTTREICRAPLIVTLF